MAVLNGPSAASGDRRRSPTRSAGRSRRAGSSWTTGRQSSRRPRRSGLAGWRRRSAIRSARRAAVSASCCIAAIEDGADGLLVCLGGTRDSRRRCRACSSCSAAFRCRSRVACDVRSPLLGPRGAARAYGPQKGADAAGSQSSRRGSPLGLTWRRSRFCPGAGAAGGLGAALAALGGELVPGAELVLDLIGFGERLAGADLVVTGEGTVDTTTFEGKAPAAVLALRAMPACGRRVRRRGRPRPCGVEALALSGDPARAREDLVELACAARSSCRAARTRAGGGRASAGASRRSAVALDERPELPGGEAVAGEVGLGDDRRRPRALVDQRDLAEVRRPGRASRARPRATVTAASPSPITKKPMPPEPSVATACPASNVRSLNDCASVSSSLPSQVGEERDLLQELDWSGHGEPILMQTLARSRRLLRLGLLRELLDAALRGVEARPAEAVQLLAALPERDRLLERHLAASSRPTIDSSSRWASSKVGSLTAPPRRARRSRRARGRRRRWCRAAPGPSR